MVPKPVFIVDFNGKPFDALKVDDEVILRDYDEEFEYRSLERS